MKIELEHKISSSEDLHISSSSSAYFVSLQDLHWIPPPTVPGVIKPRKRETFSMSSLLVFQRLKVLLMSLDLTSIQF